MLIEDACGSREEADGDEDGDEDERCRDDGAGDLGHGDTGGFVRIGGDGFHASAGCGPLRVVEKVRGVGIGFGQLGAFGDDRGLGEVALDVFDDDDGVVDDETGGESDAEEREGVDAEAEDLDEGEGTDERNGDGDGGNDGGAPILQEEEDDEDDDDDGLANGGNDFVDRFADDQGGIDGNDVPEARGIGFFELGQNGAAALVDRLSTSRALALESCRTPTPMASPPSYPPPENFRLVL